MGKGEIEEGRRKTNGEGDARWNLKGGGEKRTIDPAEENTRLNTDLTWEVKGGHKRK